MGGVGEEILPPQRRVLRCTCCGDDSGEPGLESLTTVIFTDEPGGTRLDVESRVTQMRDFAADALAGMEQGWSETLDRLAAVAERSEEHTSELQSLMRISYAVFCLKKKKKQGDTQQNTYIHMLQDRKPTQA